MLYSICVYSGIYLYSAQWLSDYDDTVHALNATMYVKKAGTGKDLLNQPPSLQEGIFCLLPGDENHQAEGHQDGHIDQQPVHRKSRAFLFWRLDFRHIESSFHVMLLTRGK